MHYARRMAKLLLNLRHVPDDEVDEVRAWLEADSYQWYETQPGRWGISSGGLWLKHADDYPRARAAMDTYQRARAEQAQAQRAQEIADGTAPNFWDALRERPAMMLINAAAIVLLLALTIIVPLSLLTR